MNKKEFSQIRGSLGKTQSQLARLLCLSPKAVQSFEEGWRNIPTYVERQLLLLSCLRHTKTREFKPCWEIRNCSGEWRNNCIVWEFKSGYYCWFIGGTFCHGQFQDNWAKKMEFCRQCEVFQSMLHILPGQ
jgi:DNA-binding XRE family transcriptional regulator